MEKQTYFIDVIVPLSVPNKFTYRIPEELNDDIAVGKRVIVQFGKSKFYTAIIYNIHQTAPANYVAKYIESIIDENPIIAKQHLQLWDWICQYYLCNPGDVLNAALPSGLKLSSTSHITLNPEFSLDETDYTELIAEGLNTVLVYQETYHQEDYKLHHPKGKKSNFEYRIQTPDRLGKAGIYKMGLGVLIGLEDWRTDSFFTALHLDYLEKQYWQTKYSISFPRLRPFSGGLEPKVVMSDAELVQLICAYRIFKEEVELSISTRENEIFRNNIIKLGITAMSAGSKTNPGGYVVEPASLEQFEISDERSPEVIAKMIEQQGYEPVWKDWIMFGE